MAKTGYSVKGHMSSFIHFTADGRKTGYSTATGGKGFFTTLQTTDIDTSICSKRISAVKQKSVDKIHLL